MIFTHFVDCGWLFVGPDTEMTISTPSAAKASLRTRFAAAAEQAWALAENSQAVVERLKFILPLTKTVAGFLSLKDEPDLSALYGLKDYRFVFPKVEGDELHFYRPKTSDAFAKGPWGLLEPIPEQSDTVEASAVDVFLVPGLAFDRKLFRLGRGRGFYDRTLAQTKALKIGLASSAQVLNEDLPNEQHDCPMDVLVTEKFVIRRLRAS